MTNNPSAAAAVIGLSSFKVYPLGFSAFEKSTIETFFRLAAKRAPFWSVTTRVDEASVVLINAATRQDFDAFTRRMSPSQRGVIVGSSDFNSGWPVIARPLKLTAVLTSLSVYVQSDVAAGATGTAVAQAAPNAASLSASVTTGAARPAEPRQITPSQSAAYSSGFVPLHPAESLAASPSAFSPLSVLPAPPTAPAASVTASAPLAAPRPAPARAPAARPFERAVEFSTSSFGSQATQRSSAVSAVIAARSVLIVDDSDVALKFMQSRLRHFGYESKLARSGEQALAMTEQEDFQFVFLDVMMAGLDGYQTCRAIKHNKGKRETIPVVVMLTSRGGTIDKIRGSMSGCDAYLTKPLNEQQLGMVLAQHAATSIKKAVPAESPERPSVVGAVATYVSRAPTRRSQTEQP